MSLEAKGILEALPAILEASSESIASIDAAGKIRGFNSRFQILLGVQEVQLIGRQISDFFSTVDNQPFMSDTRGDFQVALLKRVDESAIWVLAKVIPVGDIKLGYRTLIVQEPEAIRRIIDRLDYVENYDVATGLLNRRKGLLEFEHMQLGEHGGGSFLLHLQVSQIDSNCDEVMKKLASHFRMIHETGITSRYSENELLFVYSSENALNLGVFSKLVDSLRSDPELNMPVEMAHSTWLAGTLSVNSQIDELKASLMPLNSEELLESLTQVAGSSSSSSFIAKLFRALEHEEMAFYIQPQVSSSSGQIVSGELLVRWIIPGGSIIPPSQFVEFLEEGDFAYEFYKWSIDKTVSVLQQVYNETGQWIPLSLNLATPHLVDHELMEMLVNLVRRSEIPEKILEVEITERILADDPETVLANLKYLSDNGINIAIDDFGTGYSSLSYLRRFPLDRLKVDRVFVTNLELNEEDRLIVNSIISLAHVLGLEVIAEGIEESFQENFLRNVGCEYFQGYLTGKPMPVSDFIEQITTSPASIAPQEDKEYLSRRDEAEDQPKTVKWKKSFSTDVVSVDNEHRGLVDALNDLALAYQENPQNVDVLGTIDLLATEAIKHFEHEELVMFNIGYPRFKEHREKHKWLLADISKRRAEIEAAPSKAGFKEILHYLKYWLMRHMISEDTPLHRFINRQQDDASFNQ